MTVRILTAADRSAVRTMYNGAGLNSSWPGGAPNITLAQAQTLLGPPNVARGSFSGTTLQAVINCRPVVSESAEKMWLAIWTGSLPLLTLRAGMKDLMIDWWTDLLNRGVEWGIGRNLLVYPPKFEDFFQRLVTRGMTYEVQGEFRVVRMHPADALIVLGQV